GRRGVDDVVVRGIPERQPVASQDVLQDLGQRLHLGPRQGPEESVVPAWQDEDLERETRREGSQGDELRVLRDQPTAVGELLRQDVAVDAAAAVLEVAPRARELRL